jgi:hypothetical protein
MHLALIRLPGFCHLMLAACGSGGASPQIQVWTINHRRCNGGGPEDQLAYLCRRQHEDEGERVFQSRWKRELNKPASITDDGHTWLHYGVSGAQELNGSSRTRSNGRERGDPRRGATVTATSTSGECRTTLISPPRPSPGISHWIDRLQQRQWTDGQSRHRGRFQREFLSHRAVSDCQPANARAAPACTCMISRTVSACARPIPHSVAIPKSLTKRLAVCMRRTVRRHHRSLHEAEIEFAVGPRRSTSGAKYAASSRSAGTGM